MFSLLVAMKVASNTGKKLHHADKVFNFFSACLLRSYLQEPPKEAFYSLIIHDCILYAKVQRFSYLDTNHGISGRKVPISCNIAQRFSPKS